MVCKPGHRISKYCGACSINKLVDSMFPNSELSYKTFCIGLCQIKKKLITVHISSPNNKLTFVCQDCAEPFISCNLKKKQGTLLVSSILQMRKLNSGA
jgi:hypothetical protein